MGYVLGQPDHQATRRRIRLSRPRPVQGCSGKYERLEGRLIDFITLVQIDGAPGVAFQAGVEQLGRVLERSALEFIFLS